MISAREWDQINETFQEIVDKVVARFEHSERNKPEALAIVSGDEVQRDLRQLAAWYAKLTDLDHAIPLMAFGV